MIDWKFLKRTQISGSDAVFTAVLEAGNKSPRNGLTGKLNSLAYLTANAAALPPIFAAART